MSKIENQIPPVFKALALSNVVTVPVALTLLILGAKMDITALCVSGAFVLTAPIAGYAMLMVGMAVKDVLAKKHKIGSPKVFTDKIESKVFGKK